MKKKLRVVLQSVVNSSRVNNWAGTNVTVIVSSLGILKMNYLHVLILLCLTLSTGSCTFRKLRKLYSGVESFFDIFNFNKKGPQHHRHRHQQQHPHKYHQQKGHKYLSVLPQFLPHFDHFYEGGFDHFGHDYDGHHSDYGYFFDGHDDYDYEHGY